MRRHPGRKVAILGLGKSGYESALFLHAKGLKPVVSENGASDTCRARADELISRGIGVELGGHSLGPILASDWVLISPALEFVRYQTLSVRLSDHRAVLAELRPAAAAPGAHIAGA
jgi:UDP-N-acetylmuramoylalanine-D-glutamate ligase